jgi:hypothetical protein
MVLAMQGYLLRIYRCGGFMSTNMYVYYNGPEDPVGDLAREVEILRETVAGLDEGELVQELLHERDALRQAISRIRGSSR